jgi:hypothetical protein
VCRSHVQRTPNQPTDGVFGIDFWHAVEFSRCGRAPNQGPSGLVSGQLTQLSRPAWTGQIRSCSRTGVSPRDRPSATSTLGRQRLSALKAGSVPPRRQRGGTIRSTKPSVKRNDRDLGHSPPAIAEKAWNLTDSGGSTLDTNASDGAFAAS